MCKQELPGNPDLDASMQGDQFYFMALGNGNNCYCTSDFVVLINKDGSHPIMDYLLYDRSIEEEDCNVACFGDPTSQCGMSNVLLAPTSR